MKADMDTKGHSGQSERIKKKKKPSGQITGDLFAKYLLRRSKMATRAQK
jgi:hypothetical protein